MQCVMHQIMQQRQCAGVREMDPHFGVDKGNALMHHESADTAAVLEAEASEQN